MLHIFSDYINISSIFLHNKPRSSKKNEQKLKSNKSTLLKYNSNNNLIKSAQL